MPLSIYQKLNSYFLMVKICCNKSPFVYLPIRLLIGTLGYQPQSVYDHLCLRLADPLNKKYTPYKKSSHLTDVQNKEEQIRFLGTPETDRKLMHLARVLIPYIHQPITFVVNPSFKEANHLLQFIQYMMLQSGSIPPITIEFSTKNTPSEDSCKENKEAELHYFYDETDRREKAPLLLAFAKECANAGDYYSAINFLTSLKELDFKEDKLLELEIYEHLALCYRLVGDTLRSAFYYKRCLDEGDDTKGNSASYGLSMLYLRHHPRKYLDREKGAGYLEKSYQILMDLPDTDKTVVDRVFNRNGFALVLFKRGNIKGAETMVEKGISRLNAIDTHYSKFHQSILYYNLFQCFAKQKKCDKASEVMEHLISLDPLFFAYYEFLAEFYIKINELDKGEYVLKRGVSIDENYFNFYFLLGKINYLKNDLLPAIKNFEKAYALNPLSDASLCYLTTLYNSQEKYQETADLLEPFDLTYHNGYTGELIFGNKMIALLNTGTDLGIIQSLAIKALALRPSSDFIQQMQLQFLG